MIPPYNYSDDTCNQTFILFDDCKKVAYCSDTLMSWRYVTSDSTPYPAFDVDGFRRNMKHKRILFLGDSTMRQQVLALVWTLGLDQVDWIKNYDGMLHSRCTNDSIGNITICRQAIKSMATQVYQQGNYSLNLTGNLHDTSFLLQDEMLDKMAKFDFVFIEGVVWFTAIQRIFDSPTSPAEWIHELLLKLYRDVMESILIKLSHQTKTILVLGQTGTSCQNKTKPESYDPEDIPNLYGWRDVPLLWNQSLSIVKEFSLDVQVVDAREPLMQSVHAHPAPDCFHFCMNSAALNIHLDMYWNEVFRFVQ